MKRYKGRVGGRSRQFVAWDIEAVNWFDVICVAAVHSSGDYITGQSIASVFDAAYRRGWIRANIPWYSHAGGRYDHHIAMRDLLPDWELIRGIYQSGFGHWSIDLRRGDAYLSLRDSYRLLPGALAEVGKAIGHPKREMERENMGQYSYAEVRDYCLDDSCIVREALLKLWEVIPVDGDTLPARATRKVRRALVPNGCWNWNEKLDAFAGLARAGGHVEPFRTRLRPCNLWDLNSSYPAVMTKPLPTECIGTRRTWDGEPAIIDCEVTVPECYYPPLPFKPHRGKHKNTLMFPTGTFRGVFCSNELEHAVNSGARVEQVFHSQVYRLEPWLEEYVRPTYERRKLAKIERDAALKRGDSSDVQRWEFELYAQKLLLNAVYGKLIEDSEHENWTGDMAATEDVPEEYLREFHVRTNRGPIIPIWGIKSFSPGAFQHYASGAWIPAGGRVALHIGLVETDAAYCDTDSVVTLPGRNPSNVDASELGAWKHEGHYEFGGEFLAPKVYALDSGDSFHLRAKGFFRPEGVSKRAFWDHIKRGGIIGIEKTSSWIDQINAGLLAPSRGALYRVFQGGAPKRFFYPDGNSRPWSVGEILEH